jgi:uncharacterized repeat protein (TIGR02543 family)
MQNLTVQRFNHLSSVHLVGLPLLLGLTLLLALYSTSPVQATALSCPDTGRLYVQQGASGSTGIDWDSALPTLQDALHLANTCAAPPITEIWVAQGVYYPDDGENQTDNNRDSTFRLKNGLAIYGGFAGTENALDERDWETNVTILSGDIDGNDTATASGVVTTTANINGNNAFHVVTGSDTDATAILDGFTITAGQANGAYANPCGPECGGGMYTVSGSPTLTNVSFSGNSAFGGGGGIANIDNSSPTLTNVSFSANSASYGGGMRNWESNPTLTSVSFKDNSATNGGGIDNWESNPTLTNVSFSSNSASGWGGSMFNHKSSPTLTNVSFSDNSASDGGGMYNEYYSSPTLTNISFISNSAIWGGGGGMYNRYNSSPTLTNVSFSDNSARMGDGGGGMRNDASSPALTSVTFSSNTAFLGGGMYNSDNSSPTLTNVSFSSNSAVHGGGMRNDSSSPTLTNVSFNGNTATVGGGMRNDASNPTLTSVSFSSNSAAEKGGGMYNSSNSRPKLTSVSFSSNSADGTGGGMYNDGSSPKLSNVSFSGNLTTWFGGGMYNGFDSNPTLTSVSFSGNSAILGGGGMYNDGSSPKLTSVSFSGNLAEWGDGGGMYNRYNSSPTLTNITFIANSATWGGGGGMYNIDNSSPKLTNVSFSGNRANTNGGGITNVQSSPTIVNSVFWTNKDSSGIDTPTASIGNVDGSTPTITYSMVQGCKPGGVWDGNCGNDGGNNLSDADPLFVTPVDPATAPTTAGNLRLQAGSPAIDKGNNAAVDGLLTDLDGNPRIRGNAVDLGAYEAQIVIIALSANPANAGTVSGSGPIFAGETVTVTASANTGYTFANWTEDDTVISSETSFSFVATESRTLAANFTPNPYTIDISANPTAGGNVIGGGVINYSDVVTVTAIASQGYSFVNWTANGTVVSKNADYSFTVEGDRTLVANFRLNQYTIAVSANPAAGGVVSGDGMVSHGDSVTVTALSSAGYSFVNWIEDGAEASTSASYTFSAERDRTLIAIFSLNKYAITVSASPAEGGKVTGGGSANHGDTVMVTAVANPGYTFVRWTEGGVALSTSTSYSFTAESDRTFVANFSVEEYRNYLPLLNR